MTACHVCHEEIYTNEYDYSMLAEKQIFVHTRCAIHAINVQVCSETEEKEPQNFDTRVVKAGFVIVVIALVGSSAILWTDSLPIKFVFLIITLLALAKAQMELDHD